MKFILFCVTLDLSDNLTETRIVKNSNYPVDVFKKFGIVFDDSSVTLPEPISATAKLFLSPNAVKFIQGHTKKVVSGIKQFYWIPPICLPCRGTIYIYLFIEKYNWQEKASNNLAHDIIIICKAHRRPSESESDVRGLNRFDIAYWTAPESIGVKAKAEVKETGRIVWTAISQPTPKAKAKVTSLSLSLGLRRP